MFTNQTQQPYPYLLSYISHATCRCLQKVAPLYLRGTHLMYLSDRSRLSGRISCRVTHTSLIAITYLITDQDLDFLLDLDRLDDSGSHGVNAHFSDRDHDLDRLLDRDFALDRHRYRPLDSNPIYITRTLRSSYFNLMSQVPSFLIWYPFLSNSPVDVIRPGVGPALPTVCHFG